MTTLKVWSSGKVVGAVPVDDRGDTGAAEDEDWEESSVDMVMMGSLRRRSHGFEDGWIEKKSTPLDTTTTERAACPYGIEIC